MPDTHLPHPEELPGGPDRAPAPRDALLLAVVEASRDLLAGGEFLPALGRALAALGKGSGLDRVYVFQHDGAGAHSVLLAEWHAPGGAAYAALLGGAPLADADYPEVIGQLRAGQVYTSRTAGRTGENARINAAAATRSDLMVPIFAAGAFWGCVGFDDCQADRAWTEAEVTVLRGAAAAIAAAVEREGLETERRERELTVARGREAELARLNAALRDGVERLREAQSVGVILDVLVLEALRVTGAAGGAVLRRVDAVGTAFEFATVAQDGAITRETVATELVASLREVSARDPAGFFARLVRGEFVVHTVEELTSWYPLAGAYHRQQGNVVVWNLPFQIGGVVAGYLGLALREAREPDRPTLQTLEALALQACLALELREKSEEARHAAVLAEREQAAREYATELERTVAALRIAVTALARLDDLDGFLGELLRAAAGLAGAHTGAVVLLDRAGEHYRFAALLNREGLVPKEEMICQNIPVNTALRRWMRTITVDPATWTLSPASNLCEPDAHAFHAAQGNRAIREVPMLAGERLIGWLGLGFAEPEPTLGDAHRLLQGLADQMALAVETVRLAEDARQTAVSRERERVALERAREKTLLLSLSEYVATIRDKEDLFRVVVEKIKPIFEFNDVYISATSKDGATHRVLMSAVSEASQASSHHDVIHHTLLPNYEVYRRTVESSGPVLFTVAEIAAQKLQSPEAIQYHQDGGMKYNLGVSMQHADRTIGAMFFSARANVFTPERFSLYKALSNQMAVAVANLLANEEVAQLAEDRARRAEELERVNAALALRDRLLTAVTDSLKGLLGSEDFEGAVAGALRRLGEAAAMHRVKVFLPRARSASGEAHHELVYEWWAPGFASQASLGITRFPDAEIETLLTPLRAGQSLWQFLDEVPAAVRGPFERVGMRSMGVVPVFVGADYAGLVAFDDCVERRVWSQAEMDALTVAARALGAAIGRCETARAAAERTAELARANEALFRTVEALAAEQSMDTFLDTTLRAVAATLGAESVTMWLWRDGLACLHHVFDFGEVLPGARAAHPDACRPLSLAGNPWAQGVLVGREPTEEVTTVPERMCWTPAGVDYLRSRGVRAVVNAAIRIGRNVVGNFSVPLREGQPDPGPEAMALVRGLANQSALALELTRLTEAVHAGAVLEERNRPARDLHDMLSQSFAGIIAQLGGAEGALDAGETDTLRRCLERAGATARESLAEARRAVHALRPGFLSADTPLVRALEQVLAQTTTGTGLRGTLRVTGTERPLDSGRVEALVRIVQELLANTLHHAAGSAQTFALELAWGETFLRLEARDDGLGFDPAQATDGFGLGGIRERVGALGGRFELLAGVGRGTTAVVELPLPARDGAEGEDRCANP